MKVPTAMTTFDLTSDAISFSSSSVVTSSKVVSSAASFHIFSFPGLDDARNRPSVLRRRRPSLTRCSWPMLNSRSCQPPPFSSSLLVQVITALELRLTICFQISKKGNIKFLSCLNILDRMLSIPDELWQVRVLETSS